MNTLITGTFSTQSIRRFNSGQFPWRSPIPSRTSSSVDRVRKTNLSSYVTTLVYFHWVAHSLILANSNFRPNARLEIIDITFPQHPAFR
ncbi:hypothetical protein K443DRAFT_640528 [Laccaria amethystina LaAM-08-1]|uniref:Uncharacterized protein n=1 Tax=Laccaria amethystina LaAM-08-1 TaxID=1095629 RepID=A0A0C9XAW8_9AGAR|nr:hypothetical protein K443DRAFT_640528 [Laccaria amethystina LaAM-08-1]